jgi:hypothetical protein
MPVIAATQSGEIGRIMVKTSLGKKQDPFSTNKLGVVVHVFNPSYTGGTNKKIPGQAGQGKKSEK